MGRKNNNLKNLRLRQHRTRKSPDDRSELVYLEVVGLVIASEDEVGAKQSIVTRRA